MAYKVEFGEKAFEDFSKLDGSVKNKFKSTLTNCQQGKTQEPWASSYKKIPSP